MRSVQVIHTDLGGYFTFNLGSGAQSNVDFSASNETPQSFSSLSAALPDRLGNRLAGCEVRVSVAGFRPRRFPLAHLSEMGRVAIGNVMLERVGAAPGTAVSVTSLLVPKDASKKFEDAVKDLDKNNVDSALQHLEEAVQIYDQYAAAWNEIGRVYLRRSDREKAEEAFVKAVSADSEYLPPLVNLATLQIQNQEWENGVETAKKALELQPDLGFASFLQAVGEYNLNHLDEAERSAKEAERATHEDNPQVHALLAQIYMTREDYMQAAVHMRSYLEESPNGQFADKMKKDLADIEEWFAETETDSGSEAADPEP
jgi:tetratricopeptide (TPR) repeat protein